MEPIVRLDKLSFQYTGSQNPALEQISLEIFHGESVGSSAPTARASPLCCFTWSARTKDQGTCRWPATNYPKTLRNVRSSVGLVLQNPDDQLFMPSVFEDVAFGPLNQGLTDEEVHARVSSALDRVGLKGLERRPPHRLSRGEKRRVAIATVLAMNPVLLVLDEPTGELDPKGRRELAQLLNGLPETKNHRLPRFGLHREDLHQVAGSQSWKDCEGRPIRRNPEQFGSVIGI